MVRNQPAILAPVPRVGHFLSFDLARGADARRFVERLASVAVKDDTVLGVGAPLAPAIGRAVDGLRAFPSLGGKVDAPSTQHAAWAYVLDDDAGRAMLRASAIARALGDDAVLVEEIASFRYGSGRDLTGYEDGTENPKDARAIEVAIGESGASFVAVQRWVHDLTAFERMSPAERDRVIGRARETNEELEDAPPSAHVKRAAQESFEPEAFMLRRSMPFGGVAEHGLYFVAYGASLDPFERVLARMVGKEDGTVDALFRFSRPVTGAYYWCPPLREDGRLDLGA